MILDIGQGQRASRDNHTDHWDFSLRQGLDQFLLLADQGDVIAVAKMGF